MADWRLCPSTHTYSRNGVEIPGCTRTIDHAGLSSLDDVRKDILERRSNLGKHVHRCCHFFDEGDLNWETVHETAKGYVDSWAALCSDLKIGWRQIEFQCIAKVDFLEFGMQIDREGLVYGEEAIVDIKISRSIEQWHGVQLAGYAMGLPHAALQTPSARFMRRKRYVAKLNENGKKARLIPFEQKNDYDVFKSALVISHWKLSTGKKIKPLELEEAA
jgi:CRISPR/Cas system-associated exonuclease Cas4 (RecB family)